MAESQFDVFLTHNWGNDENGRNNHERVAMVNATLKSRGFKTWFDEDRMSGHIVEQMCNGIENSRAALVFVTKRYLVGTGRPHLRWELHVAHSHHHLLMHHGVHEPWMTAHWSGLESARLSNLLLPFLLAKSQSNIQRLVVKRGLVHLSHGFMSRVSVVVTDKPKASRSLVLICHDGKALNVPELAESLTKDIFSHVIRQVLDIQVDTAVLLI